MTPSSGFDDLPPDLEDAVLAILDGEDSEREAKLAALLRRQPKHAVSIRDWLLRAGVPVPDLPRERAAGDGASDSDLPQQLGNYLLLEVLGRGGFGTVYRAEQQTGITRVVAVKILNPGLDSREFLARFAAEREALHRMDHPGIARLLDAGSTPTGRPFFVMELVEGPTLVKHSRKQALSLRDRLRLFQLVLDAMQHAHQKAVLHRDLSSNNVLVADPEGTPQPKIIDFGIAKSLADPLLRGGAMTMQGTLMGTPEFMSPEQAAGQVEHIDTRADVYSLGVQLYELLTDQLPIPAVALRAQGIAGLAEVVRTYKPARPSEIATPPRRAFLRGDLDNIVMKAIAKVPEDRYAGVGEFAADLRRHLADEPVHVTPPTVWYRLRKYVRRHRAQSAGIVLVVLAIVATLLMLWLALGYAREMKGEAEQRQQESEAKANAGFRLLANEERLLAANAAEQQLPPPWPEHEAAYTNWLHQYGDALEDELQKMTSTEAKLASAARLDASEQHLLAALRRLSTELAELVQAPNGARQRTITRLRFLRDVAAPAVSEYAAAWQQASDAIMRSDGESASRAYRGLRVPPLPGLAPVGCDPKSKLWQFVDLATHAPGYPMPTRDAATGQLTIGAGTGIVFVLVPPGRVAMGARRGDAGMDRNDDHADDNELGGEPVSLDAFLIAETELTAMQWARLNGKDLEARDPMLPATSIDWSEADVALRRFGMQLPTEAQWEYACRAGGTAPWCCGADAAAVVAYGSFTAIQRVGLLLPNAFGLFDMHGNVAEWCRDELLPYPDFEARSGDGLRARATTNPDAMRVVRGGAFHDGPLGARCTARASQRPTARDSTIGVRTVRMLDAGR